MAAPTMMPEIASGRSERAPAAAGLGLEAVGDRAARLRVPLAAGALRGAAPALPTSSVVTECDDDADHEARMRRRVGTVVTSFMHGRTPPGLSAHSVKLPTGYPDQ